MAKTTNLNSGFLISYDWIPAFESLSGEDCKELLFALINYQRFQEPIPTLKNEQADIYARMIKPVIDRRLNGQRGGLNSNNNKNESTMADTTVDATSDTMADTAEDSRVKKSKVNHSIVDYKDSPSPRGNRKRGEGENESFNVFWEAYPKKQAKPQAVKAFEKVNPSPEVLDSMLKAIEEQKRSVQWKKDEGQFIPLPSTWLNQRRWEDESTVIITNRDETPEEFFAEALKGAI